MKREILFEKMTWPEVQQAIQDGYDTAVIITGSIEQHGPHLPLATDTLLGYAIGERVARKLGKALLAPVVRPGLSEHHMAFKGTITLSEQTFKSILRDYAYSLARHGFHRIAISWSHGGNAGVLRSQVPVLATELPEVEFLLEANPPGLFRYLTQRMEASGIDRDTMGIHAGELETSAMLSFVPDQVRVDLFAQGYMGDLGTDPVKHERLLREGLHTVTENGILGDARRAERSRGSQYLDWIAEYIVANLAPVEPGSSTSTPG
jgi:creatinine amidohydrolase